MRNKKLLLVVVALFVVALAVFVGCNDTKQATVNFVFGEGLETYDFIRTVKVGDKVVAPTEDIIPTVNGKKIVGWYQTQTFENEWNFDTNTVEKDTTLYAKWDYDTITISKALEICASLNDGETTQQRYYIRGTVKSIDNPTYGQMVIEDGTGEITAYGTYSADGEKRYSEMDEKPYAGDEVLLYANLQNYKSKHEIKSGWIIEFEKAQTTIDEDEYTQATIAEARTSGDGAHVKVSGVVARITYANGMIPSGFILVDNTSSIYVYDSQIAPRVQVGNTITILAEKAHWILDTEVQSAEKYGYKGCSQLINAVLKQNDNLTTGQFDKTWIESSTVKDVMDTPVTEDITTLIFKANALVKKVPGTGFVNYYLNDLDEKTGSYVYTQCNGSDFAWLDEFDGKICTVYFTVLNAKSTSTGCVWRLLPIEVKDDNFVFQAEDAPEFAVKYYGVGQFAKTYSADPAITLTTQVSSTLLGIEGVTLTYTSNNTDVAYIEGGVFHAGSAGMATITVKGEYQGFEYSQAVTVTVQSPVEIDYITISEAIATAVGEQITVHGIVGPSLVNQSGFYLIDDDAVIAVKVKDKSAFEGLSVGHEVIVKGNRDLHKKEGSTYHGETCISNAEIVSNLYGEHEYSTASFKDGTLEQIKAFGDTEDHTTEVYVITAKVKFVYNTYYTNAYIVTDTDDQGMLLYSSNAGTQYSWLKEFDGKEVTLEVARVIWNKPGLCVLAVRNADGTKTINTLNFNH